MTTLPGEDHRSSMLLRRPCAKGAMTGWRLTSPRVDKSLTLRIETLYKVGPSVVRPRLFVEHDVSANTETGAQRNGYDVIIALSLGALYRNNTTSTDHPYSYSYSYSYSYLSMDY